MKALSQLFCSALLVAATISPGQAQSFRDYSVGPQYGSTHVYLAPEDVDRFVASVIATFVGVP